MVLGSKTMVLEPVFGPKTGVRNRGFGTMFWGVPGPLFRGSRRDPKTGSKNHLPEGGFRVQKTWFSGTVLAPQNGSRKTMVWVTQNSGPDAWKRVRGGAYACTCTHTRIRVRAHQACTLAQRPLDSLSVSIVRLRLWSLYQSACLVCAPHQPQTMKGGSPTRGKFFLVWRGGADAR